MAAGELIAEGDARGARLAAFTLLVAAALAVGDAATAHLHLSIRFELIYPWFSDISHAAILLAAAWAIARPRHRRRALPFITGFGGLSAFGVAVGLGYVVQRPPSMTVEFGFWLWFAASILEVGVAVWAWRIVRGGPRYRVPLPRFVPTILSVAVFVALFWSFETGVFALATHGTFYSYLFILGALTMLPAWALRRADSAPGVLYGLATGLALATAEWILFGVIYLAGAHWVFRIVAPILPAVVGLFVVARVVRLRSKSSPTAPTPVLAA